MNRIHRLLAYSAAGMAAAAALAGCDIPSVVTAVERPVKGSGSIGNETREVAAFKGVIFTGAGNVEYKIGSKQSVGIETDDNLLERVETTVEDGVLTIGFKGSVSNKTGIRAVVTAPSCTIAIATGSGDIRVSDLKESYFDAAVTGSGTVSATGTADNVRATVSGSGSVNFTKLTAVDAEVRVTGSGAVTVAPTGVLDATVTGSGKVEYLGKPKSVKRSITGSGTIQPK